MPSDRFTEELILRRRRYTHLAILRLCLAVGYLLIELSQFLTYSSVLSVVAGIVFAVYSGLLIAYREHPHLRDAARFILAVDLSAMVLLALLSAGGEVGLSLLMFYFLITEAALLHGAREVLVVTSISVVFYGAWLASGAANEFRFSFSSFMFMLVVGGSLGYYFTFQSQRVERKIDGILRQAGGQSEAQMVVAVEEALRELASWLKCSRAAVAFWDSSADYYAMCQYPHQRGPTDPPPVEFDHRQEWACFAGTRLEFVSSDVSLSDEKGRKVSREFDLHPYVVQMFEIYNAVGCGLFDGDKAVGRLLLVNNVDRPSARQLKHLQEVAPLFREAVRHLLVVRRTEHDAYERERVRIAHDLHDGPLQSIISFEMRLNIIHKLIERDRAQADEELGTLYELSRKLVSEMRTFVHRMRPMEADGSSLLASARRLVEGFQKESGVAVTLMTGQNHELALPDKVSGEILKITREALHNVYKHAHASHVLLAIEKKNNEVHLSVDDNGEGYRFGGKFGLDELDVLQMGPRSVRQRVRSLGGSLNIESNPGHGSNLRITLPLNGRRS